MQVRSEANKVSADQEEDARGYFQLMEGIVRQYGTPLALCFDHPGVFKFNGKRKHIPQPVGPTHFTEAMQELGIEEIFARSSRA